MLAHTPTATQKGVADLCLCQLATMYVQIHVHKIFFLRIYSCMYRYVAITIKAACASSKHDDQNDNYNIGIRQFFTRQKFPNPDSSIFPPSKFCAIR